MAKYTSQEIQSLTKQAAQTPQVQAPGRSLGEDVVNLVGTGLQFYQQQQAQEKLEIAKQEQTAYDSKLADASMKLRQLRLDLQAQGVTPLERNRREATFLKGLGDSGLAMDVISTVKKSTGSTGFSSLSKAQEMEKMRKERERQERLDEEAKQEKLQELRLSATTAAVNAGLSRSNIENMSVEQLRSLELQGKAVTAAREKTASELALMIQNGTYQKMTEEQQTQTYLSAAMPSFTTEFSSDINTLVDEAGGWKRIDKEGLFDILADKRRNVESLVQQQVQAANAVGVTLSLQQQQAFREQANGIVDTWESIVSEDKYINALNKIPDKLLQQQLVGALSSDNAEVRGSAIHTIVTMAVGQPLPNVNMADVVKHIAGIRTGSFQLPPPDNDPTGEQTKAAVTSVTRAVAQPDVNGEFTEELWSQNRNAVEQLLDGTPTTVSRVVNKSGLDRIVKGIVQNQGKNFNPSDHEYVSSVIYEKASKYLAASIKSAINTSTIRATGMTFPSTQQDPTALNNFTLNEDTLELEPVSNQVGSSDAVNKYNSYIRDTIKALEYLGGDVERFKEDARRAVLVSSTR